jgi:flagellar hook-associated protein 2
MPVGNITGLASGIQWDETVKLMMALERRPVDALTTRRTTYQSQLTNWSAIESKLNTLKSAAESMDKADELLVKSVSSSDKDILTATGDSNALPGKHTILINQLAANHITAHRTGWADADTTAVNSPTPATNHILTHAAGWVDADTTAVNSSGVDQSFSYSYAGNNVTITVPDGSTLTDVMDLINNDPGNPGVTASITNTGGPTPFHLVLTGADTGATNTIEILDTVGNPTDLGDGTEFDSAAWDITQAAADIGPEVTRSFSFTYAGEAFTVSVPNGSTLTDLVNLINNDPDNPGVTASILNDGGGGAAPFHLVLSGQDTGEDNTVTIIDTVDNPTDIGGGTTFDAAGWSVTQTAQNAEIRVDGFPDPAWGWPNPWIEADSNSVEDIIPGLTLDLKNVTDGVAIEIEVKHDKDGIKSMVKDLIKAYNDVLNTINSLTSYNPETSSKGPLAGDNLARSLKTDLTSFIANNIPGTDAGDRFRSLGEVGIKLGTGGALSLDATKFDEALDTDATAVARMFVFDSVSSTGFVSVAGHNSKTQGGETAFTLTYDASGNLNPGGTNTIGGEPAIIHGDSIAGGAEGEPEEGLLLLLTNPGDGPASISGTMTVYTGLSALLSSKIDQITDSYDGSLKNTRDRIKDSVELLDKRISAWDERLKGIEDNYKRKFSAMETLISQLKTQSNYLAGSLG